jgi:hypothetical protein
MYDLTYLEKIINESCEKNVETIFFITPTHNAMAAVYQHTHHDESRAQWQRDIVSLLHRKSVLCRSKSWPLWGFENNYVPSLAPKAGGAKTGIFFTDGLHLSRDFSSAIAAEMMGGSTEQSLGERLDENSIDTYLGSTSERLLEYQRTAEAF